MSVINKSNDKTHVRWFMPTTATRRDLFLNLLHYAVRLYDSRVGSSN